MQQEMFQAAFRMYAQKKNYEQAKEALIKLEAEVRRLLAQKEYQRILDATVKIQRIYRMHLAKKEAARQEALEKLRGIIAKLRERARKNNSKARVSLYKPMLCR